MDEATKIVIRLRPVRGSGGRAYDVLAPDGDCLGTVSYLGDAGWAALLPIGSGTVRLPTHYKRRRAAVNAVLDAHAPE